MATPDFVLALREKIGTAPLWLSGVTAVVIRPSSRHVAGGPTTGEETHEVLPAELPEVLLVKRADNGAWTPVTGIIDPGEEPAVAAAREVLEEADIVAVPERLIWVHTTAPVIYGNGDRSQFLSLVFRFSYVSGEPSPADGENTEARWYRADALPPMSERMARSVALALANDPQAVFES